MKSRLLKGLVLVTAMVFFDSCGGSTANTLSEAAPSIAVTSPTAGSSSSAIKKAFGIELLEAPTNIKPFGEMAAEAKENFDKSPSELKESVSATAFTPTDYRAECYGPTWTDDATGSNINRPSGDLGIVYATKDGTSTEACAAAELNALIAGKPALLNEVLKLVALLLSQANSEGKSLPAVGEEVTATMPTIANITWDDVLLTRLADDAEGNAVYKTVIEATIAGGTSKITLYHSPTNADNTEFKGLFQAILPSNSKHRGLSVVYEQVGGVTTLALDGVANRDTDSTDFFDTTTGRVKFSGTAAGEDFNKLISTVTSATGAATVHYAWQAGSGDGATRSFAVTTTGNTSGSTGVAYFGYGAAAGSLTDVTTSIWATKMICHWLTATNPKESIAKLQKQTLTYDATAGLFTAGVSTINFAPTTTCDKGGAWNITNGPTFKTGAQSAVTNNLVSYGSDITAVTVPTFTMP